MIRPPTPVTELSRHVLANECVLGNYLCIQEALTAEWLIEYSFIKYDNDY